VCTDHKKPRMQYPHSVAGRGFKETRQSGMHARKHVFCTPSLRPLVCTLPCQSQLFCTVAYPKQCRTFNSFLRRTNVCEHTATRHKAMLAGESSSRGHRRWSRLDERCTQTKSAPDPQVPRCAPSHAPRVRFGDRFVYGGV